MSKTIEKKIDECTNAELRAFANDIKGLSIPASASKQVILASLSAVHDGDTITVISTERAEHPPLKPAVADKDAKDYWEQPVRILIHKTEEQGASDHVWLCVNGRGIWVPRGKVCIVKRKYLHVLENAVRTTYEQTMKENGMPGDLIPREVSSYPFQCLDDGPEPNVQRAA